MASREMEVTIVGDATDLTKALSDRHERWAKEWAEAEINSPEFGSAKSPRVRIQRFTRWLRR